MGGYSTWELAIKYPELFAAIAPIWGRINLSGFSTEQKKDEVVPISNSEWIIKALKNVDANPMFTIIPEAGHDSWSKLYNDQDFYAWVLNQEQKIN